MRRIGCSVLEGSVLWLQFYACIHSMSGPVIMRNLTGREVWGGRPPIPAGTETQWARQVAAKRGKGVVQPPDIFEAC